MTFVSSLVQLAAVAGALSERSGADPIERASAAAHEASEAVETVLDDETLAPRIADAADQETLVVLARGPARAAAEMGALTLKECGVTAESYETAAFRHGPFELAGPGLGAVVVATEPETRSLDLGLAADLVGTGASCGGGLVGGRRAPGRARGPDPVGRPAALAGGLDRPDPAPRVAARERARARPGRVHQSLEGDHA